MNIRYLLKSLGLNKDMIVMITTILVITFGRSLWSRYIPKYLQLLGASAFIIGVYGSLKTMVSGFYQYPGGIVSDKIGSKNALILFTVLSIGGLIIYMFSPDWKIFLLGTFLVLIWDSMSQPAIFSLIGEALKKNRAIGFSVQSLLKRLPIIIAPPLGGYLIEKYGIEYGVKIGIIISVFLAFLTILFQKKFYERTNIEKRSVSLGIIGVWKTMDSSLKKLLLADIMARLASNMVKVYVILYILDIVGWTPTGYGILISLQMITSTLSYLPAAKLADIYGRKPFVTATFLFFSLFPVTLVSIPDPSLIPLAFIIAGLREIGEPARKALIVDLAKEEYRGRIIGLYYLIRGLLMIPAPMIGGLLWSIYPKIPFIVASIIGFLSILIFITIKVKQ